MAAERGHLTVDLFRELRRQVGAMHQTWVHNSQARLFVYCSVAAGLGVVLLAVVVDTLRYFDFHHYRASFLSLTTDRSLSELVMDALVLIAAGLTAWMFRKTGLRSFLFVALLLFWVALDDFFSFHEAMGTLLVQWLGISSIGGLDPQALGELTFLAAFGLACGLFFLWAAWGWHPVNLAVLVLYCAAFTLFAGFSGGVDFLHSLAQSSFMDRLMGWIEEGGEILIMTALTSMAILQSQSRMSH